MFSALGWLTAGGTWSASGTKFYTQGLLRATNGTAPNTTNTAGLDFYLGDNNNTPAPWAAATGGGVLLTAIWDRALSEDEIAEFDCAPYCFLEPDFPAVFFAAPAVESPSGPPPSLFRPGNGPKGFGAFIRAGNPPPRTNPVVVVTPVGGEAPDLYRPGNGPRGFGAFIRARNTAHEPPVVRVTPTGAAPPSMFRPGYGPGGFGKFFPQEPAQEGPVVAGTVTGNGAFTDPVETLAGTGTVGIVGTGAFPDPIETIAATGTVDVAGSGALTDPVETIAATATVLVTGNGALTDPVETIAGTATVVDPTNAGSPAPNLFQPGFGPAGFGQFFRVAHAQVGPDVVAVGSGALTDPIETISGTGAVAVVGNGAFVDPVETLSGTATVTVAGTGAFTDPVETIAGTGAIDVSGAGAFVDPVETISGTATVPVIVGAAPPNLFRPGFGPGGFGQFFRVQQARVAGDGILGTGAFIDPAETIAGTGAIVVTGYGAFTDPVETIGSTAIMSGDLIHAAFIDPVETILGTALVTGVGVRAPLTGSVSQAFLPPPRLTGNANDDIRSINRWLVSLHDELFRNQNIIGELRALVSAVKAEEGPSTTLAGLILDMLSQIRTLR